jgi:hypothetical protein
MYRPTRLPYRRRLKWLGELSEDYAPPLHRVLAAACTQGKRTQHGKPHGVISDDQPDAREGQAGRPGVAERFAVPLKPGNAGGGKGPQFKTDATSGEGFGDWATYQLRKLFRNRGRRCTVATARLTGQTIGAALAALCFGLVGREAATLAPVFGAVFAALDVG